MKQKEKLHARFAECEMKGAAVIGEAEEKIEDLLFGGQCTSVTNNGKFVQRWLISQPTFIQNSSVFHLLYIMFSNCFVCSLFCSVALFVSAMMPCRSGDTEVYVSMKHFSLYWQTAQHFSLVGSGGVGAWCS